MQPHARLVWANTTPVRAANDGATNERIVQRNQDADKVMRRFAIPVDDQHTLMEPHVDLHQDNVHWNDKGSEVQSVQVADSIRKELATH